MTWKRYLTEEENEELYDYNMVIRVAYIGIEEGYEYMAAPMGGKTVSFHKSERAAYNSCLRYIRQNNVKKREKASKSPA